jgi:FlaA1/EpsC-like NDP-sugar epimerase
MENKVIFITGGTGTLGQILTAKLLQSYNPKKVIIYSRGELLQYEMARKFKDNRLEFIIGDVRDRERLLTSVAGSDIIIHASALKQIPKCEANPTEAISTNITGTINVINAARRNKVEKVIGVSSDKAVYPINIYGMTKAVMEKLFAYSNGKDGVRFACTRYGNVLGSRGSVIPLFLKQKEEGLITITDERMTRFWLTPDQMCQFVLDSLKRMDKRGEIFIPKIPSMRLIDLVDVIAPGISRKTIGIRPGEKLHEVLMTDEETRDIRTSDMEDYYIIRASDSMGVPLPQGFKYTSDTNNWWLTKEELKELIKEIK